MEAKYLSLEPGADGILRSTVFPGLWLDPDALLTLNRARVFDVLEMGLRSPEHEAFVRELAQKRL